MPFIMSAVAHIDEYKTGKFFSLGFRGEMSWNGYENNNLMRNEGNDPKTGMPRFVDIGPVVNADAGGDARGFAMVDIDNDGDLDFVINNHPGDILQEEGAPPIILRNDVGDKRHWLAISLEGTDVNRDAVGAIVEIEAGGKTQIRQVSGGSGYASQHGQRLYFGLDEAEKVDRIHITWPGGSKESHQGMEADQLVHIKQGGTPTAVPLKTIQNNQVAAN